jgi:hypothetical protein
MMSFLLSLFVLTAAGQSADFRQAANETNLGLGKVKWINSILNNNNSMYAEGMATLQRLILLDVPNVNTPSGQHILRVKMQSEKGSQNPTHAYDFMVGWDDALAAAALISPGSLPPNTGSTDLNTCGDNISATAATACSSMHEGGFSVLASISGEDNNVLPGDDATTTQSAISAFQTALGHARTLKIWGNAAFTGGAAANKVVFVKYEAGYIFYDIYWQSTSTSIDIEFAAHISAGIDPPHFGGTGYGPGQGASDINGGPYHVIVVDFQNPVTGSTKLEGSLGNLDNQLQGSDIIVAPPPCSITSNLSTCPSGTSTFSGPSDAGLTYAWSFVGSSSGALYTGAGAGAGGTTATGQNVTVTNGTGNYVVQLITTANGLSTTCTAAVTVTCPVPTIGGQGANATINCTATPTFTAPTASDACNLATTINLLGTTTTGTACNRILTRSWDATNSCGNHSATVTQTITIVDNVAPTIGAAGANATINCTATPSFTAPTASDACNGATVNELGTTTTGTSCNRVLTRSWDATDACGNHSATVTQSITVIDNTPPTIGGQGANATINCPTAPSFTAPTASDACNGATVNLLGTTTTGTSCNRVLTRSWDATDACGNHSATVTQSITIVDNVAPTISAAGANATVNCTATPTFTAPTASDACDGATVNLLGTTTTGSGCTFTLTRSWDATDACGNHSATVTQAITVTDNTPPTISAAGANATINCPTAPSFTAPTASDACSGATVNLLGTTTTGTSCARVYTRTWDATDACGNHSATVTQVITVVDTQAPTIAGQGANATINCTATPSFTAPTASDACDGATVNLLGTTTTGTSCNRVLTRSWDATDACGNHSATVTQSITIVDNVAPTISAAGANVTINCPTAPSFTAPTASDACNGATVNLLGTTTTGTSCNRVLTRSWDATDACGNHSATVTQTITVVDNTPPTIGGQGANATVNCTVTTPSFTPPTASDACDGATVNLLGTTTVSNSSGVTYTRSWDATDACNNHSATVSQSITIPVCPVLFCTYTQGYYGGTTGNGQACDGTTNDPNTFGVLATITNAINANSSPVSTNPLVLGGSPLIIGNSSKSVTITSSATDVSYLNQVMPGGGKAMAFTHSGNISIQDIGGAGYLKNGRINNVLFSQTIALGLNLGIKDGLGSLALQANKWLVTADVVTCGSTVVKDCEYQWNSITLQYDVTYSPYHVSSKISQALYDQLPTKDVYGLYSFANNVLGGAGLPTGVSYGDVANAVDLVNQAFDGCRDFISWSSDATAPSANSFCPPYAAPVTTSRQRDNAEVYGDAGLQVSAYPNPYKDIVKFTIQSKVSGQAQLVIYNSLGQRVKTIYSGYIQANKSQVVDFNAPSPAQGNMIYVLTLGGKQVTGKLLKLNQ